MPVGLSDGSYHEDYTTMVAMAIPKDLTRVVITKDDPEVIPGTNPGDYGMVVHPNVMGLNQQMDQIELDPSSGLGVDISFKRGLEASTEPTGEFNSLGGSQVPENSEKAEIETELGIDWSKLNQPFGSLKSTSKEDTPVIARTPGGIVLTEGDLDEAINVGMGVGPGIMAGVKSALMKGKLSELGHAQVLESNAVHPDEIYKQTGFFRGAEGRWRYEIDDSKAVFKSDWADAMTKPSESGMEYSVLSRSLPQILDHPELYKAYPDLKNIRVFAKKGMTGAEFSGGNINMGLDVASNKGVLLHEVQHWIQTHEGFAKGGAPGKAGEDYTLKLATDARRKIYEPLRSLKNIEERWGLTKPMQAEKDRLMALADKFIKYVHAGDVESFSNYQRLAGEVEARNVDTRLLMTEAERRKLSPMMTEDVARDKQFVLDRPIATHPYMK